MEIPLVLTAILAFIAFLIWINRRSGIERRRLELDAQAKILESIGPGEALTEFLRTDEGRHFVERITAEPSGSEDTGKRVFLLTTLGCVALFGGIVFLNGVVLPNALTEDPEIPLDLVLLFSTPVFLLMGGGIGALIAAWMMRRSSRGHDARGARLPAGPSG